MVEFHCPNCAYPVHPAFRSVKMVTCESCGTTLFLDDEQARMAGEQGVMHDVPLLFGLHDSIRVDSELFQIQGHARFSYGRGTWDEFCAIDQAQNSCWFSVDEGDIVQQRLLDPDEGPGTLGRLALGEKHTYNDQCFTVIEHQSAECIALRGHFDQQLSVGETYRFVNLQGETGSLLSGEFQGAEAEWYLGKWQDPYKIEVLSR